MEVVRLRQGEFAAPAHQVAPSDFREKLGYFGLAAWSLPE
jgi:hypothetical protein